MLKAAVASAKSFRDTQASYTRSQQKLKAMEAELQAMRQQIAQEAPKLVLTPEEQAQLDDLKFKDPDKWYQVMKNIEEKGAAHLDEKFGKVREQVEAEQVVEERKRLLAEFNTGREKQLTPEQLELEVPGKWIQEVVEGKLPFDDFLDRAYTFIYNEKVVEPTPKPPKTTDLNAGGGSSTPQKGEKVEEGINYEQIVF
jgi:hypothetical protein